MHVRVYWERSVSRVYWERRITIEKEESLLWKKNHYVKKNNHYVCVCESYIEKEEWH